MRSNLETSFPLFHEFGTDNRFNLNESHIQNKEQTVAHCTPTIEVASRYATHKIKMIFTVILTFLLCSPWDVIGTNVFTFQGIPDPNNFSSATLINAPDGPLPDHFIICSSHKQQQVGTDHTRTIYVLYEDSSFTYPWFSIGFWYDSVYSQITLWANVKFSDWFDLGNVQRETFLFWVHVCVEVDTLRGILSATISGGNATTVNNVESLTPVPKLYLRLGVVHESSFEDQSQFLGDVTLINMYDLKDDVGTISSINTLTSPQSLMFLNWSNTKWKIVGNGVTEEVFDEQMLYSKQKVLNFRIPLQWNKKEATGTVSP